MLNRQLPTDVKSCHDLIRLLFDELEQRNRDLARLSDEFKAEAARIRDEFKAEAIRMRAELAALQAAMRR
jgi:uncharacterized protein YPO0396